MVDPCSWFKAEGSLERQSQRKILDELLDKRLAVGLVELRVSQGLAIVGPSGTRSLGLGSAEWQVGWFCFSFGYSFILFHSISHSISFFHALLTLMNFDEIFQVICFRLHSRSAHRVLGRWTLPDLGRNFEATAMCAGRWERRVER